MKFLFVMLSAFLSVTALAQTKNLAVGAGLNFNTTNIRGSTGENFDPKTSVTLAVGARYKHALTEKWFFRTGATFEEKSSKYDVHGNGLRGTVDFRMSYLTVPLTAQYQANDHVGFFGGYVPHLKVNQYCKADDDFDGCTSAEARTIVNYLTLGTNISFHDSFDFDISYQHALEENSTHIRISVIQAMVMFKL